MQKKNFLRTIDEGFGFKFCNGQIATNLQGLLNHIKVLSPSDFAHHVYFDHNDFANWIIDIIEDEKLGRDIFHSNKEQTVALLQARINYLKER